jgi:hypothetical protein
MRVATWRLGKELLIPSLAITCVAWQRNADGCEGTITRNNVDMDVDNPQGRRGGASGRKGGCPVRILPTRDCHQPPLPCNMHLPLFNSDVILAPSVMMSWTKNQCGVLAANVALKRVTGIE